MKLREYALKLQDDIGKKSHDEAMKELIEEVWNAPLKMDTKKITQIIKEKTWNISSSKFPNVSSTRNNNNNNNNINIPFHGTSPSIVHHGSCAVGFENADEPDNPLYQFHHKDQEGGIDHNNIFICKNDLIDTLIVRNKEYGVREEFGKCWYYNNCLATMYPDEIKDIIPSDMYEEYKKKFNKKMQIKKILHVY